MGFWSSCWSFIKKVGSAVVSPVKAVAKVVTNAVKTVARTVKKHIVEPIKKAVKTVIVDPLKKVVAPLFNTRVGRWISNTYTTCKTFLTKHPAGRWIGKGLSWGLTAIGNPTGLLRTATSVINWGRSAYNKMRNFRVDGFVSRGMAWINRSWQKTNIWQKYESAKKLYRNISHRARRGWNQIKSGWNRVKSSWNQAKRLWQSGWRYGTQFSQAVTSFWKRHNVSRYLREEASFARGNLWKGWRMARKYTPKLFQRRTWRNARKTLRQTSQKLFRSARQHGERLFSWGKRRVTEHATKYGKYLAKAAQDSVRRTAKWYHENDIGNKFMDAWKKDDPNSSWAMLGSRKVEDQIVQLSTQVSSSGPSSMSTFVLRRSIQHVEVEAAWREHSGGEDVDVDLSASIYSDSRQLIQHVNFENQTFSARAVVLHEDVQQGGGEGEKMDVFLEQLPADVSYVVLSVTIYSGAASFEDVSSCVVKVCDMTTESRSLCEYRLESSSLRCCNAVVMGYFERKLIEGAREWSFHAVGRSVDGDEVVKFQDTLQSIVETA